MARRLLLVEGGTGIPVPVEDSLRIAGHEVTTANGEAALQLASKGRFDAIILDLFLPQQSGLDVCRELRGNGVDTPVLMLAMKSALEDRLRGFAAGADDYLTMPFEGLELIARVRAVLRRSRRQATTGTCEFGDFRLNRRDATLWRAGERLRLAPKEFELLHYFVSHPHEVLARRRIFNEVWKPNQGGSTRTVAVNVMRLRSKIEQNPSRPHWIRTVHGEGYEFIPD